MKTTLEQLHGDVWTEEGLVGSSENFSLVRRISALESAEEVLATIKGHEISGLPLIVEGWHEHPQWMAELFTLEGFVGDGEREVDVRNIPTTDDVKMSLRELVQHFQAISKRAEPGEKEHVYGKDIECPAEWSEWLESGALPAYIHPFGKDDMFSHLPVEERPRTVMCHLGIGDTMTPPSRNPCGSFGHNIMCYTADGGSAFWFMTATGSLHHDKPTAHFQERLREELDYESRLATVQEFMDAPFKVYIAEQRLGDLVLVPPRSCHQVVDHGGITIKMSWRTMGLKSFELSLYDELLIYHRLCRPESYRVRLNIFHAVKAYGRLPSEIHSRTTPPPLLNSLLDQRLSIPSFQDSTEFDQTVNWAPPPSLLLAETASILMSLLRLLDDILVQEWHPRHMHMKHLEVPELNTCSFCGADIFQSFFMCEECIDGETHQKFICCPGCYVEGRTCACEGGQMEPFQTRPFHDLIYERNLAAGALSIQVPTCTPSTLDESSRTHIFEAACHLRERRIHRAKKIHSRTHRCCSTPHTRTDPAHQVLATHGLKCAGCREYLCFKHILDLHDVHAAEAIFVNAQCKDRSAWHSDRHANTAKNKAQHGQSGGLPDFAVCMAWAASKFRKCSPLDSVRAKGGFYDECLLSIGVEDGSHPDTKTPRVAEVKDAEESIPSPLDSIPPWKQDRSLVINMRFDSPFSVSSKVDMDMDSRSDSVSSRSWSPRSWSSSSSESLTRRRRTSTTSSSMLSDPVQRGRALTKPSALKATRPGSSPQVFDGVLVPSRPKKRPSSHLPAVPTRPAKKARLVTPETPMSEISSLSFSMTPGDPSDAVASVPSSIDVIDHSLKARSDPIIGSTIKLSGVLSKQVAVNSSRVGSGGSTFGRLRLSRAKEPFSKNSSLCLDGKITNESTHAVASGGYSDVRTGTLGHRTVAIKIMRPFSDVGSPIEVGKLRLRLWREYITWSKLSHPNILECLGFSYDFSPPSCYNVPGLISPWMSNGTVLSYIITHPDADRLKIIAGITRGLEYLHNNKPAIVHGDLRAGNVLVTDAGTPCLTDFGLSRIISETRGMTTSSAGGIAGSLRWMAPEIFHERGAMLSVASDVWAYGMTVLEIFTGTRPFDDFRLEPQVLHEIMNGNLPARPVETSVVGLTDDIWTICKNCWNAKPEKRPSMSDVHRELVASLDMAGHE